jgi:hypothetical protein
MNEMLGSPFILKVSPADCRWSASRIVVRLEAMCQPSKVSDDWVIKVITAAGVIPRMMGAALLIAWAGLEASLRRAALQAGRQGKIGVQPSILIRELFAAGQLTPAEQRSLEEMRQLRTAVFTA